MEMKIPFLFCSIAGSGGKQQGPGSSDPGHRRYLTNSMPYLIDTNGTDEPGTIVVGSTPFQRSACTSVTRLGLVPSALARASMAAASAWPVILMLDALASPFSRVASALACASARTALALALAWVTVICAWTFSR